MNKQTDYWNQIEKPEINPTAHGNSDHEKKQPLISVEQYRLKKQCWNNLDSQMKKIKMNSSAYHIPV